MSTRLFSFSGEALGAIEWCDPVAGETLVADSWRVESGQAVALERHWSRFFASATKHGLESDTLNGFWDTVTAAIPREGSWFPRVEVVATPGGPTLRYRERPAPEWLSDAVVAIGDHDPRTTPLTKGPDLETLMALRRSVAHTGATEALIVSAAGEVIEGAYSTIVMIPPGGHELRIVPRSVPRIPSVTEAVIREIAAARGMPVVEAPITLDTVEDADLWVLSALHGIRITTDFPGGPVVSPDIDRRDEWQAQWWATRHNLR
jgi:branched-subunit amino acid aminotransferase/4-amino-4-deoxychorismate lyase